MSITPAEASALLTFARAIGLYVDISEPTMAGWSLYFAESPFTAIDLREAILRYKGTEFLTAKAIDAAVRKSKRMRPEDIEADVRSAKARGLVEKDWPHDRALPADVQASLEQARSAARETARKLGDEGDGSVSIPEGFFQGTTRTAYGRAHDGYKDD